ncbi:BC1881 family protein [Cytobacillus sp. Bac17]|uniref:BC1881 family protein n=1 Tax=Cytobacillus sp. Bac17 TaxID=2926008 RepID=UPI0021178FF7|nr:BC1881 family protein [Cytobacillus sp. Bac17]
MTNLSTKEISEELVNREGISHIVVEPYEGVRIITGQGEREFTGPAIIIINQD